MNNTIIMNIIIITDNIMCVVCSKYSVMVITYYFTINAIQSIKNSMEIKMKNLKKKKSDE